MSRRDLHDACVLQVIVRMASKQKRQVMTPAVSSGGAEGDRTPDLNTASVALSQLSYCPVLWWR